MTSHALLIGIDRYPNLAPGDQLTGAVNDARLWQELLRDRHGFAPERIALLTDAQATRDAILGALDRLAAASAPGDLVVLQFSGHGSWMTDREGDEPDGRDETILPCDSGRDPHPNRDITDDEIAAWLARLAGRTVTLVFDCCCSGTIPRDPSARRSRSVAGDARAPGELPPSPLGPLPPRPPAGPSGWLPVEDGYVLIAACREDESAEEHWEGPLIRHGALTFFLARALLRAAPRATWRDVLDAAAPQVTARYPRQHPQLEGAIHRELFGARQIVPEPSVAVERRDGDDAVLAAGAVHGVREASRWVVRAPLARLTVTSVEATRSHARIEAETSPGALVAGARAAIEDPGPAESPLAVAVEGDEAHVAPGGDEADGAPPAPEGGVQRLRTLIDGHALLRIAEPAELRCLLLEPRGGGGRVPQLGALDRATWATVAGDGRLALPARPEGPGAAAQLVDDLARVARFKRALELDNPGSPLEGQVDLGLLRRRDQGDWEIPEPEAAGGLPVYLEGDLIAFELTNRSGRAVYTGVLDFGLAYRVFKAHPPGESELLSPGRSVRARTQPGRELRLGFPDAFPFAPEPGEQPREGVEVVRLIATTEPVDLAPLTQTGVARDESPRGDWTVVTRRFILRRR